MDVTSSGRGAAAGDKQPGSQTGLWQGTPELGNRQSLVLPVPCAEEERRRDGVGVGTAEG